MRVNCLFVFLHALVLGLANLAVAFGLGALPSFFQPLYLIAACVFAVIVFFLANSENRWRFPWYFSACLCLVVVVLGGWLSKMDAATTPFSMTSSPNLLPLIYLFLTAQALLLVKLTAPSTPFDFWIEQSVGLAFVLFACAVCKDLSFSALLLLYIATAVVSVMAYHFRQRQDREPVCKAHVTVRPLLLPTLEPVGRLQARKVLFWGLIVAPLVLLLFFCVPRPDLLFAGDGNRDPFSEGMDLNKTGRIRLSDKPAFNVRVTDNQGMPVLDVGHEQRWRAEVLTDYYQGRWAPRFKDSYSGIGSNKSDLPNFGPRQMFFDFVVNYKESGGLPLAEPVYLGKVGALETAPIFNRGGPYSSFDRNTATFGPALSSGQFYYSQVAPRPVDPDRMPAAESFQPASLPGAETVPPGIRLYTTTLIHDLADDERYGLNKSDLDAEGDRPRDLAPRVSVRGERIAVALCTYLHSSRDFAYTLDRPRSNKAMDPTEDFLVNVRQGHCERFAGALASMLRAEGVPARVVVGYKGRNIKSGGQYVVLQNTAHAWVEALVPPTGASAVGGAVGCPGCDYWLNRAKGPRRAKAEWLSLDPTTPFAAPPPAATGGWFSTLLASIGSWFKGTGGSGWQFNPISFDAHAQADFFAWVAANLPYLLVALLLGAVVVYLIRLALQRLGVTTSAAAVTDPFYQRLLALLSWYRGLEPQPAQTPREFGEATARVLEAEPAVSAVAGLPAWIIELYYRVRFGGRPLQAEEARAVEARLEELQAGLKKA
jgi:hypothetical protein